MTAEELTVEALFNKIWLRLEKDMGKKVLISPKVLLDIEHDMQQYADQEVKKAVLKALEEEVPKAMLQMKESSWVLGGGFLSNSVSKRIIKEYYEKEVKPKYQNKEA